MKLLLLLLSALIFSCSRYSCQPSSKSKDYAVTGIKTLYRVTYVKLWGGKRISKTVLMECLPDSLKKEMMD